MSTDIVKVLHSAGYSTAHKQLEFTRNLLRGIGMPNAQEVIKYSGGGTDGGKGKKESDFRKKWGPDVPPVMERFVLLVWPCWCGIWHAPSCLGPQVADGGTD